MLRNDREKVNVCIISNTEQLGFIHCKIHFRQSIISDRTTHNSMYNLIYKKHLLKRFNNHIIYNLENVITVYIITIFYLFDIQIKDGILF